MNYIVLAVLVAFAAVGAQRISGLIDKRLSQAEAAELQQARTCFEPPASGASNTPGD